MTDVRPKAFTWRITEIPTGTTSKELVQRYFTAKDRDRITVGSLCPDVDGENELTATLLFRPHPEQPDHGPELDFYAPHPLEVEKDFEGFTPLYCPPEGTFITADIVALTGLAGHAFGSWAHSPERMWLRDYVPKFAPSARILTYGYNTRILGGNTSATILADLSNTFVDNLITMRDVTKCDQRPVIFIGHSLGCMIIKKAMTSARYQKNVDSSRLPVRAIIFLAAPHRGMNVDALRTLVKDEPPRHLIDELAPGSPTLEDLNERFINIAQDLDILTCFETRKTKTVVFEESRKAWTRSGPEIMMLEAHSAKQYWPKEKIILADADHSGIAKLKKGQGGIFQNVKATILRALTSTAQISRAEHLESDEPHDSATAIRHETPFSHASHVSNVPERRVNQQEQEKRGQNDPRRSPTESLGHSSPPPIYASQPGIPVTAGYPGRYTTSNSFTGSLSSLSVQNNTPNAQRDHWSTAGYSGRTDTPVSVRGFDPPADRSVPFPYTDQDLNGRTEQFSRPERRNTAEPSFHGGPYAPRTVSADQAPPRLGDFYEPTTGYMPANGHFDPSPYNNQIPHNAILSHHASIQQLRSVQTSQEFGRMSLGPHVGDNPGAHSPTSKSSEPVISPKSTTLDEYIPHDCDGCDSKILGIRYKCLECADWDYCADCFGYVTFSHPKHQFAIFYPGQVDPDETLWDCGPDRSEKPGIGKCSKCSANIASPDFFYQCSACSVEDRVCQSCQKTSKSCLLHQEPVMKRQFIWYGDRQESHTWIDEEPTAEDSILIRALKEQDMDLLDRLVQDQRLINVVDGDGRTPLHVAAHLDLEPEARFILMHGAKLEARDKCSCTPLGQAILSKNLEMVHMFLERGANPDSVETEGNTPLHLACVTGSIEMVEMLLEKVKFIDKPNNAGETALFRSCQLEELEIAKILVTAGANLNMSTKDNEATLLGELAKHNKGNAIEFLLDHGATLESTDSESRTTLLHAAVCGHSLLCSKLLKRGANPNAKTKDGDQTVLGQAAANSNKDTIVALLDGNADIEGKDSRLRTPLFRAAGVARKLEVCRELLDRGANPNPQLASVYEVNLRMTPLNVASFRGLSSVVQLLLEYGADLEGLDEYGSTSLYIAAEYGHLEVCQYLIDEGADVDAISSCGHSVVSIAATYGHLEVVQLLLDETADAMPPAVVKGQKWKNFIFNSSVDLQRRTDILSLLRLYKHG